MASNGGETMNRFAEDLINALREALAHAKGADNCIEHRIGDADGQTNAATFFAARSDDGNAEAAIDLLRNAPDIEPEAEDRIT